MTPWILALLLTTPVSGFEGFDKMKPNDAPSGWQCGTTGGGAPKWAVRGEPTAPSGPHVLEQTGRADFAWCVDPRISLADGFVEVRLKPVAGEEDQAGGLIWRWKDRGNYYLARANALEDNVTIYKVVDGRRRSFKTIELEVAAQQWHTLRVEFKGNRFSVIFNGKRVIEADDSQFSAPGPAGVWTKADSVTAFDDFQFGR
jgi:hypothetical protein